jgi:hypothetical protein
MPDRTSTQPSGDATDGVLGGRYALFELDREVPEIGAGPGDVIALRPGSERPVLLARELTIRALRFVPPEAVTVQDVAGMDAADALSYCGRRLQLVE